MPYLNKNMYYIFFTNGSLIDYYALMDKYKSSYRADFYLYIYDEYNFLSKYINNKE